MAAFSLVELVFALGLAATLSALAVPRLLVSIDEARTVGAARYVSTRLQRTRMEAVTRNAAAALRITRVGDAYSFVPYLDGNRNGVLSRDIQSGVDRPIGRPERLSDQFPGVELGTLPGLPAVDGSSTAPGADPVRLGASDMATFTALGSATAGSLYILGHRRVQLVVRIFGETGRTRILMFNPRNRQWTPLGGG